MGYKKLSFSSLKIPIVVCQNNNFFLLRNGIEFFVIKELIV